MQRETGGAALGEGQERKEGRASQRETPEVQPREGKLDKLEEKSTQEKAECFLGMPTSGFIQS